MSRRLPFEEKIWGRTFPLLRSLVPAKLLKHIITGVLFERWFLHTEQFQTHIFGSFSSSSNGVPSPISAFIDGFRLLLLALNVSLTRSLRASYVLLDVHFFTVGSKLLSWQK